MTFDLTEHLTSRPFKRPTPYVLGSIWKRRDGKRAVIVSNEKLGQVRAIVVDDPSELPYLVYADSGHVSKGKQNSSMDLIYRDKEE